MVEVKYTETKEGEEPVEIKKWIALDKIVKKIETETSTPASVAPATNADMGTVTPTKPETTASVASQIDTAHSKTESVKKPEWSNDSTPAERSIRRNKGFSRSGNTNNIN